MGLREDWEAFDKPTKIGIGVLGVAMVVLLIVKAIWSSEPAAAKPAAAAASVGTSDPTTPVNSTGPVSFKVLPETPRNQGLEDMQQDVNSLKADLGAIRRALGIDERGQPIGGAGFGRTTTAGAMAPATAVSAPVGPATSASGSAGQVGNQAAGLDGPLPTPGAVDLGALEQPTSGRRPASRSSASPEGAAPAPAPRREIKVWPEDARANQDRGATTEAALVIPANSALEAVMLSGINARPSGSINAAVGTVNSANSVGAPFVTRLKGMAILPNAWKVSDVGDCFLGGSGTAVLSAERAYVIANTMSCVAANGDVWEGEVKAYGLDVDGTLGVAGKVVSKQGSLMAQAALTGIVSGLGAGLSPQQMGSYQSNASNGSQAAYQLPNPRMLAETSMGMGVERAAAQLSKFYLDYAKEVFPVVEVTAGTRVTWVLSAALELKRRPSSTKTARLASNSAGQP